MGSVRLLLGFAASGDTLYVAGAEHLAPNGYLKRGVVMALDRRTGNELWTYTNAGARSTAGRNLTVARRLLLVADLYGNSFYALDRFTGAEVWRVPGAGAALGPSEAPVVSGDTAFVASNDRSVTAVDLATGSVLWTVQTLGSVQHFALCGHMVLANNQQVVFTDRRLRRVVATYPRQSEVGGESFPVSGFAAGEDRAVVVATDAILGVSCD